MAGLKTDPQNWFMSAVGDPLNWAYSPATITTTIAVAGNNSDAGLVGDAITCLAPYNDDLLVMGGEQSIWLMRGDPAEGGRIDAISHAVGIIGPDAWCLDPQGNMYFFGGGVFYRMGPVGSSTMYAKTPGGMPDPLSAGRMDATFGAVDATNSTVRLMYDETLKGVHIYITPINGSQGTHYWWDARTDGFFPEQYPAACGPTSVLVFQSPTSTARADLLGGQDGYLRQVDSSSKSDDGMAILSRVKLAPLSPGSIYANARISRIATVLDASSDPVTVRIYADESPEEVVKETVPAWSYMASPVDRYSIPRIGGNSTLLELGSDSVWVTGRAYVVGAWVIGPDGLPYVCAAAHTSGTFATDLAALDWTLDSFRSWALESVSVLMEVTGRTRHRRI
jgi:hypothetical protein